MWLTVIIYFLAGSWIMHVFENPTVLECTLEPLGGDRRLVSHQNWWLQVWSSRCQEKDEIQHFRPGGNCQCERFGRFELCFLEIVENVCPNNPQTLIITLRWGSEKCPKVSPNPHRRVPTSSSHRFVQLMPASWKRGLLMKNDRYLVPWPKKMSGCTLSGGQHWFPRMVFYRNEVVIPQNMGWHEIVAAKNWPTSMCGS